MDHTENTGAPARKTVITKNIKQADPIPEAGIEESVSLMKQGKLYRYNVPTAQESVVSLCEQEVAEYTGHKYCVALNSCGSALFLSLKCAGVKPGDKVLTNAFTFTAVPSAIEHAGGVCVYVETEWGLRLDIEDLEQKIKDSGAKYLMVSHMRGKICDLDAVLALCEKYGVYLIEDAAHSMGVLYKGKHTGHHGKIACVSSQSYKIINSGEGGFLLTDDPEVAAATAVYAGAYEKLSLKHLAVPGPEYFEKIVKQLPNYSLRMHAVSAAMIRPQIKTIDARREKYNARYATFSARLNALPGVEVPQQYESVTPIQDSIQFNLKEATDVQIQAVMDAAKSRGLLLELFGHHTNARYFKNWEFAPTDCELPKTERIIKATLDMRMPLTWEDSDFEDLYNIIEESLKEAGVV